VHCLSAQFITIKGNRFYDVNNKPFYPVVCNYWPSLACENCTADNDCTFGDFDPGDVYIMPDDGTLDAPCPSLSEGAAYISAAFAKIYAMGFNTVRLQGFCPCLGINALAGHTPSTPDISSCSKFGGGSDECAILGGYPIGYTEPYSANHNLNDVYMPKLKQILALAKAQHINVILGLEFYGEMTGSDAQALKAQDLFESIATSIASDPGGHPEILAYELFNEPSQQLTGNSTVWNTTDKHQICTYTTNFYNAIKAKDPNHLITVTSMDAGDVVTWDPAVIQADFISLHAYTVFYITQYDGNNEANALARFQDALYWMSNNSPVPWVITENGAIGTYYTTSGYQSIPGNGPFGVWGTLSDQSNFAQQTQQMVLNNGGSGYSWWYFADQGPDGPGQYSSGDGLLTYGHPNDMGGGIFAYDNSDDKPIVTGAFESNIVSNATAQMAQPSNYYNDYQPLSPCPTCFSWSGTIVDQEGNPIKDAVISATNNGSDYDGEYTPNNMKFSIITYSHADGTFTLTAPVPSPAPAPCTYDYGKFDYISISAAGASWYWWWTPWSTALCGTNTGRFSISGAPNCSNPVSFGTPCSSSSCTDPSTVCNVVTLNRKTAVLDNFTGAETINSSNSSMAAPFTLQQRHILATDLDFVESTGYANFQASSEVAVSGAAVAFPNSFIAQKGSYTHIFCKTVPFDCSQLTDPDYLLPPHGNSFSNNDTTSTDAKNITVDYMLQANLIRLMPNPASSYFYLLASAKELSKDDLGAQVEITDAVGHTVYLGPAQMDGQTPISTSAFAAGFYTVQVMSKGSNANFKLIISR
jgi:hypothetical protein